MECLIRVITTMVTEKQRAAGEGCAAWLRLLRDKNQFSPPCAGALFVDVLAVVGWPEHLAECPVGNALALFCAPLCPRSGSGCLDRRGRRQPPCCVRMGDAEDGAFGFVGQLARFSS